MTSLRRVFLSGLLVLAPVTVTVWVFTRLSAFLDHLFGPLYQRFLKERYVPGMGVVTLLLLILAVGLAADTLTGRRLMEVLHRLLLRVPFFNKVYLAVKGISDSLLSGDKRRFFQGVVLVPFPNAETKTLAFITDVPERFGLDRVGVFVPTVPNITTGFYLIYRRADVEVLDMSVEEGIGLVISAGISSRRSGSDSLFEK